MSADDTSEGEQGEQSVDSTDGEDGTNADDELVGPEVRDRLGESADKAIDQFDEGLIDLLAWILETETRARIYISLRKDPNQTSDEIAEGTGLYPSTVREALASLHEDDIVTRAKRQNAGAGNNPYEYTAIPPSDLVGEVVDDIQKHLNDVFNLDKYMDRSESPNTETEPVTITVTEESDEDATEESDKDGSNVSVTEESADGEDDGAGTDEFEQPDGDNEE